MQPVQIGIIGCGYWGPNHVRVFEELPEATLSWVCDRREDRLTAMRTRHPQVRTTCSVAELLASAVDAVVIATPIATHAELAMHALCAGKHVLLEKPMATTVEEAEALVAMGQRQHRVLMIGHTFEYNPAVETLRQLIASGELGDIYYVNSTRVNLGLFQPDVNVIWDLAPHDVSILQFILGQEVNSVCATGGIYIQRAAGIHDMAHLTLHFSGEILANVHVSWLDPCKIRRATVVGSRKMVV
ncbi:MAG: Gfo/Idh/MocA family oxidoreductase, partial [Caldilineaceae bacterium]|nr:Gfo/Idh/MocA family oxidoreductase [Caldilineaceae bacterium]